MASPRPVRLASATIFLLTTGLMSATNRDSLPERFFSSRLALLGPFLGAGRAGGCSFCAGRSPHVPALMVDAVPDTQVFSSTRRRGHQRNLLRMKIDKNLRLPMSFTRRLVFVVQRMAFTSLARLSGSTDRSMHPD